jgi:group II intron reverse transcriptase/maturase
MQNAETVLSVIRERGRRGLPLERLYRNMFNPQLCLLAYGRIYANKGAMTPGVDGETADGMSTGEIRSIIDALRHERYRFKPVRRTYIPKKNGKMRPLGLPSWSDKLVGEVVRLLLEAYYEPEFSDRAHGFRPGRGCHTALRNVAETWTGTAWFVESDVADCFGSFDHEVMLSILGENIHDGRFLNMLANMLQAGYIEDWVWNATYSGTPQGGVVSPILSNIYLHKLDEFVETELIPEYNRGEVRGHNREYLRVRSALARARKCGDREQTRKLRKQMYRLPSKDTQDPGYRRLHYVRYADDALLGFNGPKAEAEQIKARLATFLHDELKLELSQDKTLITHARTGAASFLGYQIATEHRDSKISGGRRSVNGMIQLRVPPAVIKAKCALYCRRGKPAHRPELLNDDDHTIVGVYGAEYRGIVNYYLLAHDIRRLNRLHWVMETSMLKTLAGKHQSTVAKMAHRHKRTIITPDGPRTCFEAATARVGDGKPLVARFGGIPLKRQRGAVITNRRVIPIVARRKQLITRLLAGTCEICASTQGIRVHQVRKLADLNRAGQPQPTWAQVMAKRRRKTLVVCTNCHGQIHAHHPTATLTT